MNENKLQMYYMFIIVLLVSCYSNYHATVTTKHMSA